ncbi:hypothetical protein FE257_012300 [Aspergillus nanangensis]|uniref:Uncharacterized protein n=1 Tax=Aspergillus nanangensis TaxID=2582783 RepID=A0AAD4CHC8_ASPNN|nr:hypothetical protein FE257_012300 [Aspergillus nanangensis]
MYLPSQGQQLDARQNDPDGEKKGGNNNNVFVICAAVIVFALGIILMSYFALRTLRRMNCRPKYLPGNFLKDRWNRWQAAPSYGQIPNGGSSSANQNENGSTTANNTATEEGSEMNTTNGVRRDTSVRSVITLPPYSFSPKPTEQVLAREGERGGMDVVVEFPETAEEEETRREDLMEGLYQIRQQRRQEIAEREDRRRERREARARGDFVRLEQLRIQSRARASSRSSGNGNTNTSNALTVAEHQSRGRERRISSVSYAEVGYVRHDGSRLRADSPDSDRSPLLSNAAAVATDHSNRSSTSVLMNVHSRGESYSSVQSAATGISDSDTLTQVDSHAQSTHSTRHSVTEPEEGDVGAHVIPPPPDYDNLDWGDAPPYESPVADRGENVPRLRQLTVLPSIQVEAASPVGNTPTTPTNPHHPESNSPVENSSNADHAPVTTTTNTTTTTSTTAPSS